MPEVQFRQLSFVQGNNNGIVHYTSFVYRPQESKVFVISACLYSA